MDSSASPRRVVTFFLALTFGLSSIFYVVLLRAGGVESEGQQLFVYGLMWCPGVAALVTQLRFRRTLRGLGWGWGGTRFQLAAFGLPLAYAACVYLAVWFVRPGAFSGEVLHQAASRFGIEALPDPLAFLALAIIVGGLGIVPDALVALGEELGWRGLLVPELTRAAGFSRAAIASGVVWAIWHYPLVLFGGYHGAAPVGFGLVCFTIMVVGISFPLAWLRLRSGSVWTAVLLHASHNLFIQGLFDRLTVDTGPTGWLVGEFGAGLALAGVVVGYLFWRRREPDAGKAAMGAALG